MTFAQAIINDEASWTESERKRVHSLSNRALYDELLSITGRVKAPSVTITYKFLKDEIESRLASWFQSIPGRD